MMSICLCALDDDESTLFTLEAMARTQRWDFSGTTDVNECLAWLGGGCVDMLLLDYHMPKANGEDVLRRVKALFPELTVLMLTIEQSPAIAERLLLAGAGDFINKPVRLADFLSRIRLHQRLREQERSLRPALKKGISEEKLRRVVDFLKRAGGGTEIEVLADGCGMSYTTAHRYLDHLVKTGLAVRRETRLDGRPGRPAASYSFVGIGGHEKRRT